MKKTINLSADDVVRNRKTLTIKLNVWKKIISCAVHEETTLSKIINKAMDNYIKDNNYNVEDIFKDKLEVKQVIFKDDKHIAIDYKFDNEF